jgi:hypothetical protein
MDPGGTCFNLQSNLHSPANVYSTFAGLFFIKADQ